MKFKETIYNHTNLKDKKVFNYAFPLRHTFPKFATGFKGRYMYCSIYFRRQGIQGLL